MAKLLVVNALRAAKSRLLQLAAVASSAHLFMSGTRIKAMNNDNNNDNNNNNNNRNLKERSKQANDKRFAFVKALFGRSLSAARELAVPMRIRAAYN